MRRRVRAKTIRFFASAAVIALIGFPAVAAECLLPTGQAPVIPDGATATADQLKNAQPLVQSYVNQLESYQDCVEARIKLTMKTSKPEDLQKLRDAGNAAVAQATALSQNFSAQVKAFKARAPQ